MIKLELSEQEFALLSGLLDAGVRTGIPGLRAVVAVAELVAKLDAAHRAANQPQPTPEPEVDSVDTERPEHKISPLPDSQYIKR